MEAVEEAYYQMANTLNTTEKPQEIIASINDALTSLLHTDINTNYYATYNIILVAKLFIKRYSEKYCYLEGFKKMKILLNILNYPKNSLESNLKR